MEPERGYARSGDTSIAYAVLGEGPFDLLQLLPVGNPIEMGWEIPVMGRFWERLAAFSRLILVDQRGTGASDAIATAPTLDEHVADVEAVVDALGLGEVVVAAGSQATPQAILYAHRHPESVRRLLLYGATARLLRAPDYPHGFAPEQADRFAQAYARGWGTGATLDLIAPSAAADRQMRQWWGRAERTAGNPGSLRRLMETFARADVRAEARELAMPTLLSHRAGDALIPVAHARWLAEAIPDCTLVEVPGSDHMAYFGDVAPLLDTMEEYLTGGVAGRERVLTTLLFTDIAGSTQRASALGDRAWRSLLERHDAVVRTEIAREGGTELSFAGDGFLAEFPTASAAVRAARRIRATTDELGLAVRAGIHTTECERIGANVGGLGVHVAARVASEADGGEILLSQTTAQVLLGAGIGFEDRGERELRGVPGRWRLLAVSD